jgi:cytochrome P450
MTTLKNCPRDPIAAVTSPDPYPFYAELTTEKPFYWDDGLKLWVASSARAIEAVLDHDAGRVRPAAEPVPKSLAGSPAGELFGRLVRMTDGDAQRRMKAAISTALAELELNEVARLSARHAKSLGCEDGSTILDFACRLPVHVLGTLLGFGDAVLPRVVLLIGDFVRGLSPAATHAQVETCGRAAAQLIDLVRSLLVSTDEVPPNSPLLQVLLREAERRHCERETVVANIVGLFMQSYEATAGLICNTVVALSARPDLRHRVVESPDLLNSTILEVARHDSPIQNTRRFIAVEGDGAVVIESETVEPGDTILVVLAAANRDPAANPVPEAFDPARPDPHLFTFGHGVHACPGQAIALAIASAGVAELIARGVVPDGQASAPSYQPSVNARIPSLSPAATWAE